MKAIIFANGDFNPPESMDDPDVIIAADGGTRHCLKLGIYPDYVIGDLDSLSEFDQAILEANGARFIRFPERKDNTDLELAIMHARGLGASEALIFGALGKRWDQTVANLLVGAAYPDLKIRLVDGNQEISYLRSGDSLTVSGNPGDTLSLIPLCGDATGITTRGLEYPLEGETLIFGGTRGVSNVMIDEQAEIAIQQGLLLCLTIRKPGSSEEE